MGTPLFTEPARERTENTSASGKTDSDVIDNNLSAKKNNILKGKFGPHKSRISNALDPGVDSDLDTATTVETAGATAAAKYDSKSQGTGTASVLDPPSNAPESEGQPAADLNRTY